MGLSTMKADLQIESAALFSDLFTPITIDQKALCAKGGFGNGLAKAMLVPYFALFA